MNFRRACGFKLQINPTVYPADRGYYDNLQRFDLPLGNGKSKPTVFVEQPAYRFDVPDLDWEKQPRLVVYKKRYWVVADFATGLELPSCFGECREDAVIATAERLKHVGEKRFHDLVDQNIEIIHKGGALCNGEYPKVERKSVTVEAFTGTQLSLL